jgi:hypothetical protein
VLVVEGRPLGARARREDPLDLRVDRRADRLELALGQVGRPTPAHHAVKNFGSSAAERDPAVRAAVGAVAEQPARQLESAAPRRRASAK